MRNITFLSLSLLLASPALAVVLPTADTADPIKPQHIEVTGLLTAGLGGFAVGAAGRIGFTKNVDGVVRMGTLLLDRGNFQTQSTDTKEATWKGGFEISSGLRYRLLQWDNILSLAVLTDLAVAKSSDIIFYGLDPRLCISHRRVTGPKTSLFFGLSVGAAVTHKDSGRTPPADQLPEQKNQVVEADHTRLGPLFSMAIGYGFTPKEFAVFDAGYRANEFQISLGLGRDF